MKSIGDELSTFFREKNITQDEIAEELGVSQSYVSGLLTGKKGFGKKQAQRFFELWGISPSWLLTGEGEMLKKPYKEIGETKNRLLMDEPLDTARLLRIIESQQNTIERLSRMLESLSSAAEHDARTA